MSTIKFTDGSIQFRLRIITSLLTQRPILITNIRSTSLTSPGLSTSEASFLHLIDKITNGSKIEINTTGTQLKFHPGILLGSSASSTNGMMMYEHTCEGGRSIGWFFEGILPLLPFGKEGFSIVFYGITDGKSLEDPSIDYFQYTLPPILSRFGISSDDLDYNFSIKILNRGGCPDGGGKVKISCPIINSSSSPNSKSLHSIDWTDEGKIKRIRGYAISCRMNPTSSARLAHATKGLCLKLLPDVWIHTDVHSASNKKNVGGGCGPNPSLGVCLYTQSTTDVILCAETSLDINIKKNNKRQLPEDLGQYGAALLLQEVQKGGVVDTAQQTLVLLWMCLTSEDVSRVRLGTLSPYTIQSLRLFKLMFGVEYKVRCEDDTKTVLLSCLGTGYRNLARAST